MGELTMFWKKNDKGDVRGESTTFVFKLAQDRYLRWKCSEMRIAANTIEEAEARMNEAVELLEKKIDEMNEEVPDKIL